MLNILIEIFKPSKKNLLILYLLQTFPWVLEIIFHNNKFFDALVVQIANILIVYIYSKIAETRLQSYYIKLLNIALRYLGKGVVLYIIYLTVWTMLPSAIFLVQLFFGGYAIYFIAHYYIELFRGISMVWVIP